MFNPFNPFQANSQSQTPFGQNPFMSNPFAGGPFGGNPFASNPFASNPFMGQQPFQNPFSILQGTPANNAQASAQSGAQAMFQDWQRQMQTLFDPQKLLDMFPKELTQAWTAMAPNNWSAASSQPNAATVPPAASLGGVDLTGLMASQQKNLETLASAQTAAINGWQLLLRRQAEIFHDTMQTAATAMNELMAAGAPEDKLARQADIASRAFDAAGRNVEELTRMATQSQQEAIRTVTARVQESLEELKRTAQKGMRQGMEAGASMAGAAMNAATQAGQAAMGGGQLNPQTADASAGAVK